MIDTNPSPRQSRILNFINSSNGASRSEIEGSLRDNYPISKPTLVRDLDFLLDAGLIRIVGKGKNTKYFHFSINPLLKPFAINSYFDAEPDERLGAKKTFDFHVFNNLRDLFSENELSNICRESKSFIKETSKLSHDISKRELERFIIELSWKSSKIEGNTYSLLETEALIKENREAEGKSKEETQMIINHKEAFDQILRDKDSFKEINLSLIEQLHNALVKNLSISAGLRKQAVGITGTVYKPLDNEHQIREAMEKFINCVNKTHYPLEKALIVNSMIPYIQPFSDGNKRTGRMLTNAILLAYDFYPLSYRSVSEDEFKKALILFYEQNSIYHLKSIFVEQLVFANKNYFK